MTSTNEFLNFEIPDNKIEVRGFQVITWKYKNVGGTRLVCGPGVVDGEFTVVTGPTNWGYGSWGPFPAACVTEARDLRLDDRWSYPGSPHSKRGRRDEDR